MLTNEQMINLVVREASWEDVIVKIVAEEEMDPWDIDIIRLADTFVAYVEHLEEFDLRIPARFILIAAILLKMKSDIIATKQQKILISEPEQPESELLRTLASIPPLQPPIKRVPLGSVAMNELIVALRKAFEVRERRTVRKARIRKAVEQVLGEEEDISERIEKLLGQIYSTIGQLEESVSFSKLIKKWERIEIVRTLVPLLHLSQEGKVSLRQEQLFEEIFVELRKVE